MTLQELVVFLEENHEEYTDIDPSAKNSIKRVVLLAGEAEPPSEYSANKANTLYLKKKFFFIEYRDGPKDALSGTEWHIASPQQHSAFIKAGFKFEPETITRAQKNKRYELELTDPDIVAPFVKIVYPAHNLFYQLGVFAQYQPVLNKNVSFTDFFCGLQQQRLWHTLLSQSNPAPLTEFLTTWLHADFGDTSRKTSMGTAVQEIPLAQLIYLDGRYESAAEILKQMETNDSQGQSIFTPSPYAADFSKESQQVLTAHPTCANFIQNYQLRHTQILLPKKFYDALHFYLVFLFDIHKQYSTLWTETTEKRRPLLEQVDSQYQRTRNLFYLQISNCCSKDEAESLKHRFIAIPSRDDPSRSYTTKFDDLIPMVYSRSCMSQQIFLWYMLCKERPTVTIPKAVINHPDARVCDWPSNAHTAQKGHSPSTAMGTTTAMGGTDNHPSPKRSLLPFDGIDQSNKANKAS